MVFVTMNQIMPTAILMVVIAQQQQCRYQLQPSQLCQQLMTQVIVKKFLDPFCFVDFAVAVTHLQPNLYHYLDWKDLSSFLSYSTLVLTGHPGARNL